MAFSRGMRFDTHAYCIYGNLSRSLPHGQKQKGEETMSAGINLEKRTTIVTGAARGLGEAISLALAAAGAAVGVLDVSDGAGTVAKIRDAGGRAKFVRCDITDFTQCKNAVQQIESEFGPINILVNNAALYANLERQDFEDIDEKLWNTVMAVNINGVWNMCRAVSPGMRTRKQGSIINISSSTARTGAMRMAHYVTSKAAVIGLTRALARELGEVDVRVNTVSPTLVATESSIGRGSFELASKGAAAQQCLHRNPVADDIVGTVIYLASDLSSFVTGQTLAVDGGLDLL
jgi:NAD(P)-dependent dehydrogenase (short-subunit alcohol dehydrogenase family)